MRRFSYPFLTYGLGLVMILVSTSDAANRPTTKKKAPAPPVEASLPWTADQVPECLAGIDQQCRTDLPINQVLNLMRFGKAAYDAGEWDLSKSALGEAIRLIEAVEQGETTAQQAKKTSHEESEKFFKGESYERALTYLYRGLLYFRDRDYGNARACFRSGQMHDAAELPIYQGDYKLLLYLEALCDLQMGEETSAQDIYRRAAQIYEAQYLQPAVLPPLSRDINCVVIVESGLSPIKYGFGKYNEELAYARNLKGNRVAYCSLSASQKELAQSWVPTEDVFYQALTRGSRVADAYNKGKATFKSVSSVLGDISMLAGAGIMAGANSTDELIVGGVVTLFGAMMKGASASAKPNADVRYWDNIPEQFHVFALNTNEPCDLEVAWNDSGRTVLAKRTVPTVTPDASNIQVVLVPQN